MSRSLRIVITAGEHTCREAADGHGCSEAGGAERAIYHAGPTCEMNVGGAS